MKMKNQNKPGDALLWRRKRRKIFNRKYQIYEPKQQMGEIMTF